jgi:hypothetical protein
LGFNLLHGFDDEKRKSYKLETTWEPVKLISHFAESLKMQEQEKQTGMN